MIDHNQLLETSKSYLVENYGRLPMVMARGCGSLTWDANGKRYIDFFAGFGAGGVCGHCHPKIAAALKQQADLLLAHGNLFSSEPQILLAEKIISHSFPGKLFFCHSGAEANEAALKLVRKAASNGRYKIISFNNCFHGRTMGALSLTPASFQQGFEPMLPGNISLPLGDLAAVSAAIDNETAGIFVEPIQAEGGMNIPSGEFMLGLRELCDQRNILLVCDEVWTAPARTGKWFAYQHFGIEPDVMTLAKALGGGAPVAACVIAEKWAEVLGPGTHGCTMGGNPLCTSAAKATLDLIEEQDLVNRATVEGDLLLAALRSADLPGVQDIRGKGMMIGIEFEEQRPVKDIMLACLEQGLIVGTAKKNVIRLAPALTTPRVLIEEGVKVLVKVIKK